VLLGLHAAVRDSQTSDMRPTNAGILMFGYDPQLYLPQSEVVYIKYADTQGIRAYVDRKNFAGTLPELIDKMSSILRQYINGSFNVHWPKRSD
jgi:predicted HTH transcriptional regulator